MNRVAIYNRCSTEEESQRNALHVQAQESRELAEENGWCVVAQYIESQSGTTSAKRKEYQKLLQAMEEKQFDIVMVKSIDRLTRNTKDWYLFLDSLVRNQIRLYLYLERKFYQSDDALITGIKAILAEQFSKELSQKIKNAHRRRQEKQSGFNITRDMFGWEKIGKNTYQICEEEAAYFRHACVLVEQGYGYHRIAKTMYEMGARQKNGNRISEVVWRNMLRSPHAHGAVVLRETEYDFDAKRKVKLPKEETIIIENAIPPLISDKYHQKIIEILDSNANKVKEKQVREKRNEKNQEKRSMTYGINEENQSIQSPRNYGKHALSGKVICASCGAPYYRIKGVWKCSTFLKQGRENGCRNPNVTDKELERQLLEKMLECNYLKNSQRVQELMHTIDYEETRQKVINKMEQEEKGQEIKRKQKSKENRNRTQRLTKGKIKIKYSTNKTQYTQDLHTTIETSFKQLVLNTSTNQDSTKEIRNLRCKQKKLKQEKEKLLEKLLKEVIRDEDYQMMSKKIEEEQQIIAKRLEVISEEVVSYNDNKAHFEQLMEIIKNEQLIERAILKEWCSDELLQIIIDER